MKTYEFNVTGAERKTLVKTVSNLIDTPAIYHPGKPKFAYIIGAYTIDCKGTMEVDDSVSDDELRRVLIQLATVGFTPGEDEQPEEEMQENLEPAEEEPMETHEVETNEENIDQAMFLPDCLMLPPAPEATVTIKMPRDRFTDGDLDKLRQIICSKHTLLKKSLGATKDLTIDEVDDTIAFAWLPADADANQCQATAHLIEKLCHMAKTVKRVMATEHAVTNEKYSFRCFLLRLGFIGPQYKMDRKVLLHNFTGSAAFKNGKAKKDQQPAQTSYDI